MSASAKRPREVVDLTEEDKKVIDLTRSQADSPPMFDSEVSATEATEEAWAEPMLAMFDQVGVSDEFLNAIEKWALRVTPYRVSVVGAFMEEVCEIMSQDGTLHHLDE